MSERLSSLRAWLRTRHIDGFLLPVNDEFMGEYVPASAKRLEWLTGFSGSAGMAVVLQDKAAFFTDGRYTLQAAMQVKGYELYNSADTSPEQWLKGKASGKVLGYDARLHTLRQIRQYEKSAPSITWRALEDNPVDALWADRPAAPASPVEVHPLQFAGEDSTSKRKAIAAVIKERGGDALVLTAPDSLCWLLNVRADDVPYTPFMLCNALMDSGGRVTLYADKSRFSAACLAHLGEDVAVKPPAALGSDLAGLSGRKVLYDPSQASIWFYQRLSQAGADILEAADPCQLPKARKNAVELEGMRQAHMRDGLAVTRFLYWLEEAVAGHQALDEITVAERLEAFRRQSPLYLAPSFSTIAGSGPNGAIVHYHATPDTNRALDEASLLLIDSGGQYKDGTTDITRTVAIGQADGEMKEMFTRVLKGHIALARAVFPEGTSGSGLDVLARQFLWRKKTDYDHGTGHGVGSYLSVHEGPQRISKRGGDVPLAPGMIVSNEPGYYKTGAYGIRIESLVAVKAMGQGEQGRVYLGFETLTLVPLDMRLVDTALLDADEIAWLRAYHQKVYDTHAPSLNPAEKAWLRRQCEGG